METDDVAQGATMPTLTLRELLEASSSCSVTRIYPPTSSLSVKC